MKYYSVLTIQDEVVDADPEWVRDVYMPISCPRCKHVLPEHAGAIDIDIIEEPVGSSAGVRFPIAIELFRSDFFGALQEYMPEYFFGSVRLNGKRFPKYVSVFAGDAVRLMEYADQRCTYQTCPSCGRMLKDIVVGNRWFRRTDVGNRLVFSGVGGTAIYVAQPLIDNLDPELRRELKLSPFEVRGE